MRYSTVWAGPGRTVEYLIYTLVGIAGVYLLFTAYKMGRASRRATHERRKRDATTRTDATADYDTDADNTES
jgi:threonine/homoserine/homoserine lactone efflux protein